MQQSLSKLNISSSENKVFMFFSGLTVALIIGLLCSGIFVWNTYKEDIINEQKEQMQIVSDSISQNFEAMISSKIDELEQLANQITIFSEVEKSQLSQFLTLYIEENSQYIDNITIKNADDSIFWQKTYILFGELSHTYYINDVTIEEYINDNYEVYFLLIKKLEDGRSIEMTLSLNAYYQSSIADITIGDSGYVILKNSDGIILMHPTDIQIGEHVIYGREELYEGVDLSSLVELVQQQTENEYGVYEYYSYWWPEDELTTVRKIASHNHVNLGDDFLIVSAMLDYNDIYQPVVDGFKNTTLIFTAILIIILLFAGYVGYLQLQSRKNLEEIAYLKELNSILEQTKKVEENITHQQRLQIMGTLTSGIAHEFNNMLTPIIGYAELLQMDFDEKSEHYDFVSEILKSADRAKDIIKQISALGRKSTDSAFSYIKARKFISNTSKMINSMCPSNIKVEISNEIDSYYGFLGNETQINQVILNLFVNATHAINDDENGKISLICRQISHELVQKMHKVGTSQEWSKYIQLQIIDNGMGMDDKTLEQIFNPFFTTKHKGKGTGLGLSLVEQIITSHKGYIFATSQKGVGTTFYVYLPIADYVENDENIVDFDNSEILFVDNSNTNYKNLEKNLKKLEITPIFADHVDKAREVLAKGVNIMFIDNNLSTPFGVNRGINFAMSIHNQYPNTIKIIMIDKVNIDVLDALDKGFINNYIEKPIIDTKITDILAKFD
ncbi:MAG: ATP-binding protein [Clostridia bacterium]